MRMISAGVTGAVLAAALLSGCSSTNDLSSGTEGLVIKYTPNPSGAGRYERAGTSITRIRFLPNDPATAAIYGNTPLSMRFDPFVIDLTQTTAQTYANLALATGEYKVTLFELISPNLVDTDVSATPATCIEGVATVPSGPASGQVPPLFTLNNPAGMTFSVRPGQTKLAMTFDVPGLISDYESAFTCNPDCGGGTPCLTSFNPAAFQAAIPARVTFQ
jgi:hypothetical protein